MTDSIQRYVADVDPHVNLVNELFGSPPRKSGPPSVTLPFRVRIAQTEADLAKALRLRAACYSRHFGDALVSDAEPDPEDLAPGSLILLAEDKRTGDVLGCLRFMTNRYSDLSIQKYVDLPPKLQNSSLADIWRLSVTAGARGRLVKAGLFKAVYLCALAFQVRYLVIGARGALIRGYEGFFFKDIVPGGLEVELLGLPHRILYVDVVRAAADWEANGIRWLQSFMHDQHPDIEIFNPLLPGWARVHRNGADNGSFTPSAPGRASPHQNPSHMRSP